MRSKLRKLFFALRVVFLVANIAYAANQPVGQAAPKSKPPLAKNISSLVTSHESQFSAKVGVSIVRLSDRKTIFKNRHEQLFTPASNQKLLTTAAVLDKLSANYFFNTKIYAYKKSIIVVGDFDPTLGDPVVAKILKKSIYDKLDAAAKLAAKSQSKKYAQLICHCKSGQSFYPSGWKKKDIGKWYAAPVSRLAFYNNCIGITFAKQGGKIIPKVKPNLATWRIINKTKRGAKHLWRVKTKMKSGLITFLGKVATASKFTVYAPVDDPDYFAGRVILDRFVKAGLLRENAKCIVTDVDKKTLEKAKLIAQIKNPISFAIDRANRRSLNMSAESLYLKLGDGNWANASRLMSKILLENFALNPDQLKVRDGSGLSATNKISPANMTTLLRKMTTHKAWQVYRDSLAVGGKTGTLRRRFRSKDLSGKVIAKTGYISGVICLSGYILDKENAPAYAFSIMINGSTKNAKRTIDEICARLIDAASQGLHHVSETQSADRKPRSADLEKP